LQRDIAANRSDAARRHDPRVRRGSEYDAFYRTLEMPPGAPLADIEAGARLLHIAFQTEGVPEHLKRQAEARTASVERAVDELRYFWQTYGAAPPSADLEQAGGLFDALVEALGESAAAVREPPMATVARVSPPTLLIEDSQPAPAVAHHRAEPTHRPSDLPPPAAPGAPYRLLPPVRRFHYVELAAVLAGNDVFNVAGPAVRRALPALRPVAFPAPRAQPPAPLMLEGRAVPLPARMISSVPPRSVMVRLRAIAVRAGVAGLALAFGFLLQLYAGSIPIAALFPHATANPPAASR
jgi:hypothetical protein